MVSRPTGLRWSAILLGMLSLSIGWGIRGNFGHEYGAMIAGALCAMAVALGSGREDWRRRVLYFGVFGALGWGFGGSMAYMPPLGYTHSGHLPTQVYGFLTVFVTGFLWASMGGAGTAYAAVEGQKRLTAIFRPLGWVLAIWAAHYLVEERLAGWYLAMQSPGDLNGWFRQQNPFYWLDSDWLEACLAIAALSAFDLWDRRFGKFPVLVASGAIGALLGWGLQAVLVHTGWMEPLLAALVQPQGDLTAVNPATGLPFDPNDLMTNWPQVFFDLGHHLGWILGAVAGVTAYFWRYGQWRSGASLLMHLALGGLGAFVVGPVLLSNLLGDVGGFRMVPPRGDNWAVCLGVFLGMLVYMIRRRQMAVVLASVVAGVVGGLGLMVAQFLKLLAFMPGNPVLTEDVAVRQAWTHWRSANWHSLLTEQGVGLLYGLGIVLALALLARRVPPQSDSPRRGHWTLPLCVVFLLNGVPYLNLVKNVEVWTEEHAGGFQAVSEAMRPPLWDIGPFSAGTWFNLIFILITVGTIVLLLVHLRRPLAVVPANWLGKGQLVYLLLLWTMVIGNFERALVGFREVRLGTEATIFINALIATLLILVFVREDAPATRPAPAVTYGRLVRRTVLGGMAALLVCTLFFTAVVHGIYGDRHDGWGKRNLRFGPEADWRVRPILKSQEHR